MSKTTSIEYLNELEQAALESEQDQDDQVDDWSDAETLAKKAAAPPVRKDGGVVGSLRQRRLTAKQLLFAQAKIAGKSSSAAYREAYPDDRGSDRAISANAYRLTKHPMIRQMLENAWEETTELLAEDLASTKRYVLRSLVAMSRSAKQEGSKLKALELLGKATGAFTDREAPSAPAPTAEQLKKDLSGHLRLLDRAKVA